VAIAPVEAPPGTRPADPEAEPGSTPQVQRMWVTIVWDDPVNLMSYVAYVFRSYFGYPESEAEGLMMQVHTAGRAVVSSGSREAMERDVSAMHEYGLWATLQADD